jgi:elongator complex protein 3
MKSKILNSKERTAILAILASDAKSAYELAVFNRQFAKKYGVSVASNANLLMVYREEIAAGHLSPNRDLERMIRKRAIRTMSGIAPVAVLTKPFACPGKCAYCPTEKDVPQSYLSTEPAVMRAIRCGYDPYVQVMDRLKALEANGHEPTKIELIVIGGTWSVLPIEYKYWYIASCFKAANDYGARIKNHESRIKKIFSIKKLRVLLKSEQKKNETAKYQLIGITLETRPDYIDERELLEMREFGCTRVELGVQAIDDEILKLNKRGHGVDRIISATALLRDYGFKITYHLMPGLPGATAKKDLKMFKQLFHDENFQPDQIKFYPTVVTKGSLMYKWWLRGEFKPYSNKVLEKLIIDCKAEVPNYVRIIRLIRDIPGESIVAGNTVTNLRQVMQQRGVVCNCIRCREAREQVVNNYELLITKYAAAGGTEYFLEFVDQGGKVLLGFCRLRLPNKTCQLSEINQIKNHALVRELHVYGVLVSIGDDKKLQHAGFGKKLLLEAEKIAQQNGFDKIAVISGVGVRNYYRKFGYKLRETYMCKKLK